MGEGVHLDCKEGEEKQVIGTGNLFIEIIVETSPNLEEWYRYQPLQAFRKPNRHEQKIGSPQHI